jgi:PilZ domain
MPQPQQEQRATRRFSLRLPLAVKYGDGDVPERVAHTRDVSARGVCFYMDSSIAEGSEIEFTLTLPPEITLTESIRVHCKGRVVRVDAAAPGGKVAIAAIIDRYEFLAEG